jgi:hypothetical protein
MSEKTIPMEQYEMIQKNILEISEKNLNEQKEIEKSLVEKASKIIVSLPFAFSISYFLKNENFKNCFVICLIFSWIFAILCNFCFENVPFLNSKKFEDHILKNLETHTHQTQIDIQMKWQNQAMTETKNKTNVLRGKLITISYCILFLALFCLIGGFLC